MSQLFQCCRETAKLYGPLRKHVDILDVLGVDGMSSDELSFDPHTSQPTYTIVKPSWWHRDLHNWLKAFDQLHHWNHVHSWSLDKRGTFTHLHAGSQNVRQYMPHHVSQSMHMTPSGSKAGSPFTWNTCYVLKNSPMFLTILLMSLHKSLSYHPQDSLVWCWLHV